MVIILPCAGGCAANFRRYTLNKDLVAYEYPGHWTRYEEPLIEKPYDLIESIFRDIIGGKYGDEVELLGHSMGGLLAWLIADRLIKLGFKVNHLYIAACCEPQIKPTFVEVIKNDDDIKNTLKSLRQFPERVLNSDFFNDNLLPPIRTDFSIVKLLTETMQEQDLGALPVDITCFYGADDPIAHRKDMLGWSKYTSGKYRIIGFKGDHFFLYEKSNVSKIIYLMVN